MPTGKPALSWRIDDGSLRGPWEERSHVDECSAAGTRDRRTHGARVRSSRIDSLALPLLARIVSAHGGSLETTSDPAFAMTLRWPRFQAGEPVQADVRGGDRRCVHDVGRSAGRCASSRPAARAGCRLVLPPLTGRRAPLNMRLTNGTRGVAQPG